MPRMKPLFALLVAVLLLPLAAHADEIDPALTKACPGLAAWAATHPHHGEEAAQQDAGRVVTDPTLRDELAQRSAADQKARNAAIDSGHRDKAANLAVSAVDADNRAWLKGVVASQGFPTVDAVGMKGVADAWLLVQHADPDPAFQAAVLKTLQSRLASGGVHKYDVALLTDRVLLAQGKPQRYSTQFALGKDGTLAPQLTEDLAHLAERRAAMDLMPLPVYQCMLRTTYAPVLKPAD